MRTSRSNGIVIPRAEERLRVKRRQVEAGRIRVKKTVHQVQRMVDEPVIHERVHIERIKLNKPVSAENPPAVREEGKTLIIPIFDEVIVVRKHLVVREELRITRQPEHSRMRKPYLLRREQAEIQRLKGEVAPVRAAGRSGANSRKRARS